MTPKRLQQDQTGVSYGTRYSERQSNAPMSQEITTGEQYKESLLNQIRSSIDESKITDMKSYCDGLSIGGINDKAGYDAVQKAITQVVSARTAIDRKRKELKEPFKAMGEAIDSEAKRIISKLQEIEAPLKEKKAQIDNFAEAERQRLELEKRARYEDRVKRLMEAGIGHNGVFWFIGVLNYTPAQIQEWSDREFDAELERMVEIKFTDDARKQRELEEQQEIRRRAEEAEKKAAEQAKLLAEAEAKLAQIGFDKEQQATLTPVSPAQQPSAPVYSPPVQASKIARTDAYMNGFDDCKRLILARFTSETHTKAEWINVFLSVSPE